MFFDASLNLSSAQAITATAASTNIYDITGAGSGNAPALSIGRATTFGADMGLGDGSANPYFVFTVPTAFVSGGGATLTIQIQGAPDNGSNAPGTWTTIVQTQAFTAAQLVANAVTQIPIPPRAAGEVLPRFYRVNYLVATSTFSAGNMNAFITMSAGSIGQFNTAGLYAGNFVAA